MLAQGLPVSYTHLDVYKRQELNLDELALTSAESKATYDEIKAYVLEKHGLKAVSYTHLKAVQSEQL